ncbi:pilus assembly protein [Pigmentiphaga aceris]|uniref:Pilus assembly protein n=1 Tax=Pigmentiphaga aceris TaxID=1940612 RepID=A0A5C0B0U2_9BURK|nr:type II secretion system F family protein [Pigmentiphaga aceris]QEI07576.1 pilus assembly protein [Pigmentiphaga aceris]
MTVWVWLAMLSIALAAGAAVWMISGVVIQAFARQRDAFTEQAGVRLSEAFLFIDPSRLWIAAMVLAGLAASLTMALTQQWILAGAAAIAGMVLPRRWLNQLRLRRQHRFDMQLPDALLALAGGLRAGASVQGAVGHVVAEANAPLNQELGLMLRQQRLGVSFEDALLNLQARMPTEATVLLVSSLRIASDTGGNLADALERIASTVRSRLHMEGRIRALTAQGRLQALVVGLLPVLLVLVLHKLEPEAMAELWRTPMGWATLTILVMMETCGLWLIRRIVRIDV